MPSMMQLILSAVAAIGFLFVLLIVFEWLDI